MSGWIVYSKDGSHERCKLRSLEYGGTAMGERAVTATFGFHSEVAFEVFDYIEYRGERFELEAVPTVKKLSSFEYQYELRFVSLKYELERCEMRDLVPSDNGVVYPTPLTFSFTGDVRYLTDRIQACLDAMYGAGVWKITIAEGTSSEEKNITIAQQNCWNALALVNSTYGLNFYIKGRTITIGGEQPLVSHTFEYGKGNGLYEIERASDTETGIVTKLRAYGSTRNLDYSYPKKPEWSDSVLPVSFALSPLRLMLPSFKTDGKTDYVLADNAAIAKYGIREASMVYDDIYPSIAGATYNGQAIDEIKAVDAVDESQKTFVVYFHDLGFDLEEHLTTSDAQISMKSGALQGYTFTISSIEKQTGGYKITLGKNSLENSEESGAYLPGVNWNMKAGDKFVLLNILMPQKYIRDAENRLLARANEYLAQYSKTNFSYNIGLHDKFLIQNPSVYDSLIEGSKLKVYDKEIGIDEEVTIQSITITENLEDNILPQVKVTLNNEPSASTLDRIQGKLNEVAAETAANGFTTQSEIMAQYRRKLDKPFFDKLFVAIDANGNEIPSTDVITPIAYIKAKYHVVSVGGFTMYAMGKDVDIPSLASGLPFDGRTIWYNPETNQIEVIGGTGGGSGEGVSNFWDLSGIPSWITISKPKYTYSEIEGTPDLGNYALRSDVTLVSEKLNDFLEGSDTDNIINKWKELEVFLNGLSESDNLATILSSKVGKDYVDGNFVTLSTTQSILAEKDFVGGLKVNGSPIYYDSTKKYWKLEGDLLVTGGVTMYGSDSSFVPSTIMDAILYDDATLGINSNGQLYVKGGTSGGGLDITALQNYLTQNSYLNVAEGDGRYLKLSGGTINGENDQVPLAISNTASTLRIGFVRNNEVLGYLGFIEANKPLFYDTDGNGRLLLHERNYSSYALPLTGGKIIGKLQIQRTPSNIAFYNADNVLWGHIGFNAANNAVVWDRSGANEYEILHRGNYSSYALPLSGGTISNNGYALILNRESENPAWIQFRMQNEFVGAIGGENGALQFMDKNSKVNTVWHSGNFNPSNYLPLSGGILTGDVIFVSNSESGSKNSIFPSHYYHRFWASNDVYVHFYEDSIMAGTLNSVANLRVASTEGLGFKSLKFSGDGTFTWDYNTIWHAGNDGSGSGLDADLLDGKNLSDIIRYEGLNNNGNAAASAQTITYWGEGNWGHGSTYGTSLNIQGAGSWNHRIDFRTDGILDYYQGINTGDMTHIGAIAFTSSNVASATKLQTARTIWGQSFDGTVDVDGALSTAHNNFFLSADGGNTQLLAYSQKDGYYSLGYSAGVNGITTHIYGGEVDIYGGTTKVISVCSNGLVGVYTKNQWLSPAKIMIGRANTQVFSDWANIGVTDGNLHLDSYNGKTVYINFYSNSNSQGLYVGGSILTTGGVTMYSDSRKKTILNHVELSLQQVANAPLIEHYYNSDQNKTTHVGSIAQYWASMNDWFCKLDNEGYYTMEIQNAALASAISIARELDRYESKTDKQIKKLKKRIGELEEEIENLKNK